MSWDEFSALLSGISCETPLGKIVSVRSEKDKERIKRFTPEEKRIRSEWRAKHKKVVTSKDEYSSAMNNFANMFRALSGKGG